MGWGGVVEGGCSAEGSAEESNHACPAARTCKQSAGRYQHRLLAGAIAAVSCLACNKHPPLLHQDSFPPLATAAVPCRLT
jgi:hypothetical protein